MDMTTPEPVAGSHETSSDRSSVKRSDFESSLICLSLLLGVTVGGIEKCKIQAIQHVA
jgi:hypothetical protein